MGKPIYLRTEFGLSVNGDKPTRTNLFKMVEQARDALRLLPASNDCVEVVEVTIVSDIVQVWDRDPGSRHNYQYMTERRMECIGGYRAA